MRTKVVLIFFSFWIFTMMVTRALCSFCAPKSKGFPISCLNYYYYQVSVYLYHTIPDGSDFKKIGLAQKSFFFKKRTKNWYYVVLFTVEVHYLWCENSNI